MTMPPILIDSVVRQSSTSAIGTNPPSVDGCQNPRKDGAAKKVGMALAFISAAPCSRTLGGKRWLGDKPCQGRQPPEAGAAGPPLQGLPPSHTRPPRSTADPRDAASSAIYARIHAAGNTVPATARVGPVVGVELPMLPAGHDFQQWKVDRPWPASHRQGSP